MYPRLMKGLTDETIEEGTVTAGSSAGDVDALAGHVLTARLADAFKKVSAYYNTSSDDRTKMTLPGQQELRRISDAVTELLHGRAGRRGTTYRQERTRFGKEFEAVHPDVSFEKADIGMDYFSTGMFDHREASFPTAAVAAGAVGLLLLGAGGVAMSRRRRRVATSHRR